MTDEYFMLQALKEAKKAYADGEVPVGAIITMKDKIIARAHNQVERLKDPTAHAEVTAIRDACKNLQDFQLQNCEVYTSCEPCPMCMGAIYWARPARVYFAASRMDAAKAGFDDSMIYNELIVPVAQRKIEMSCIIPEVASLLFDEWIHKTNKTRY